MLFHSIYNAFLILLATLFFPKFLYQLLFHKKYRKSLLQRFGIGFPNIKTTDSQVIWVHGVSVGEIKAIAPLVKRIKACHPKALIISSSVTETGLEEAKKSLQEADFHVFLPLDFPWVVNSVIQKAQPDIVILSETDFWYNFMKRCKKRGAQIFLVNGKLSKTSAKRYQKLPFFPKKLFSFVDKFLVQNALYKERFLSLGIDPKKVETAGNLKFDADFPVLEHAFLSEWKRSFGIDEKDFVLVAGSTHHPEEKILLDAFSKIWEKISNVTLLLVPRHPERFEDVAKYMQKQNIAFTRFSQKAAQKSGAKVILVDTMGMLRQCYQLADIALVAGSFTPKVGGHNLIEPSWYGVPVVYGPYTHAQKELEAFIRKYDAGRQIKENELSASLIALLESPQERHALGERGKVMVDHLRGATERTYEMLFDKKNACKKKTA